MTTPVPHALPNRLDSIQALRGVAAMLVLFFHVAEFQRQFLTAGSAEYELTRGFWDRGGNGVDLFFVISGFIMVYVTRNVASGFTTARQFLWSRITRIYPLWWVCAGIMAGYFWISYGIPAAPDRVSGPNEAWGYALKSFILFPQASPPILGVGWTLIHEMFFYLIFAASLLTARRWLVWVLLIWAALTLIAPLIWGGIDSHGAIYKIVANPMSLEFIAGALTAMLFLKCRAKMIRASLCWGLIIAAIAYVFIIMQTGFEVKAAGPYMSRTLIYIIPASLLVFALPHLEVTGRLSVSKIWRVLGDWSYSLYLTHFIVLVTMRRVLRITEPYLPDPLGDLIITDRAGVLNNLIFAVTAICLCLVTAWVFYAFIERPSLAYVRRFRR